MKMDKIKNILMYLVIIIIVKNLIKNTVSNIFS